MQVIFIGGSEYLTLQLHLLSKLILNNQPLSSSAPWVCLRDKRCSWNVDRKKALKATFLCNSHWCLQVEVFNRKNQKPAFLGE